MFMNPHEKMRLRDNQDGKNHDDSWLEVWTSSWAQMYCYRTERVVDFFTSSFAAFDTDWVALGLGSVSNGSLVHGHWAVQRDEEWDERTLFGEYNENCVTHMEAVDVGLHLFFWRFASPFYTLPCSTWPSQFHNLPFVVDAPMLCALARAAIEPSPGDAELRWMNYAMTYSRFNPCVDRGESLVFIDASLFPPNSIPTKEFFSLSLFYLMLSILKNVTMLLFLPW